MLAFTSPKYARCLVPLLPFTDPTLIAVRTPPSASNDQYVHPLAASSEYTRLMSLPTNTRPATIDGCAYACAPPGNPNAHLSVSFGTSAAVRPGAGSKRELVASW